MYPKALTELIRAFSALPGIGPKSAERMATFLAHGSEERAAHLAQTIVRLKSQVHVCRACGTLSEDQLCPICADPERDRTLLCVVETPADLAAMEASQAFKGIYHVLGGNLLPMDGIGPDQLNIERLRDRLAEGKIQEVLIATNPTMEGEATADLLARSLKDKSVRLTRLACGVPVGGNLQYMDALTLRRALAGRTKAGLED
ncbi:MAG: recombination mediator RecR [Desulfarculales bacterium]|jgi:recombination protein RecR|nr:recombination mediator RecR [Desulfarculales bacterium]